MLEPSIFKDENLRLDAILGALYDQTLLMLEVFLLADGQELKTTA
jgi:hypothetical protein